MRISSPALKKELVKGLNDSGLNVIDIGLSSSPTFYFAVAYYNYDGEIQVSASHNPKEYNGFKIVKEKALPVSKDIGIFGAELSGHYFYKKSYGTFEMPATLIAKFLKFLSEKNMLFSEVVKPYQKYFHSGEINFRGKSRGDFWLC